MGPHQTKKASVWQKKASTKEKGSFTEWEKVLINHISDKGLITKI